MASESSASKTKPTSTKESRASVLPETPAKRQKISYPASANPYQLISFSEIEPEIIARVHHELSIDIQSPHSQLTELGQAALIGHLHENNEHIRRLAYLECCRSSPTWDVRQQWVRDELAKRAPELVDSFYKPRLVYAPILPPQKVPRPQWKNSFISNPLKDVAERQRRKGGADSPISVASTTDSSTLPVGVTNGDEVALYYEVGYEKNLTPMKPDVTRPAMRLPQTTSFVTPGSDERFGITVTVSDKPSTKDTAPAAHKKAPTKKPFPKRRISIDLTDSPPQKKSGNFEVQIPQYEPSPSPESKAKSAKPSPAKSVKSAGTPLGKTASTPSAKAFATPSTKSTPLLKSALKRTPSAQACATLSQKPSTTPSATSTPMREAILIRVQHSATQSIPFRMKQTTIFSHLMDQALKKLDAEMHRGFLFKGKLLQPNATPRDVGMQGGDVVELRWWWGKKFGSAAVTW